MITKIVAYLAATLLMCCSYIACANIINNPSQHAGVNRQIITTDWSIAETLLMLNAPVVGIGDVVQYNNWVVMPNIPNNVIDLGLRAQPNMEALINANANTLINSSWFQKILPPELINDRYTLYAIDFYNNDGLSWQNTIEQTLKLGEITKREAQANALIANVEASIDKNGLRISEFKDRPIAMVQFIDSRHLRIYGNNSLYGVVLNKLHLHNAWQKPTNGWGFMQISLLDLANLPPNTLLIVIAPYPTNIAEKLNHNQIWLQLPFINHQNYRVIPAVWAFGALPSMQRFSDLLTDSLLNPKPYSWRK
ncbi:ABC transporter substrate-binding protein [Orbus wheelerorum]|uniref:ABC transporter substrate-binding protein n=1 Tax=Orbus wheelerorum TaxID=3074111 RepID=UPI00370D9B8B